MSFLAGARIGLLEARLSSELAELVRREGGEPVCAPAVQETQLDVTALVPALIEELHRGHVDIAVFLTGAGAASLLEQAGTIGALDALVEELAGATTVCRGPKPALVLRKHGIPVHVNVRSPHTTPELLEVLPDDVVRGRGVAVLHDGGGNSALVEALRARGATVGELRTYTWRLPDDLEPMEELMRELLDGRLDAVAFTSQVQVRHLFELAARTKRTDALRFALRHRTIVGSIGPTCSVALEQFDAPPHVVASPPKMRPLVTAVGQFLAERRSHHTTEIDS
ncbi:MAG TPA: uroporphyrinogen-III synthase [Gemmatimonadaceae bacterium]